ncbi:carbohydrate ABC transporter permease [Natronospirillum operosum]|uniref:carbohydrate ABC transporter permease n=1 Tax=Natronospirillum operosum TaxID=2759953 RepID=UPI00197B4438|nr:sugar ABC transporter permease [Natronospirillum operosum]
MNTRIGSQYENPILAAPMIVFLLLLLGFPSLLNIIYSFSAVGFSNIRTPEFQGLQNYQAVFNDPMFWQATRFSLKFATLTALAECGLGLFLAIFLSPLLRQRPWLLAILMMPMMVAPAMMGLMYRLVLHEFVGPLPHYLFKWFGDSPAFLSASNVFTTVFVIETLQWTPFVLLLCYMAYNAINPEIKEAATVDGARPHQLLWYIELPLILPTVAVAFFIRFIDGFRIFDNIFVLTGAGAGGSTTSLSIYIYQTFFRAGDIGKALAASVVLFVVSFLVLFIAIRVLRRGKR